MFGRYNTISSSFRKTVYWFGCVRTIDIYSPTTFGRVRTNKRYLPTPSAFRLCRDICNHLRLLLGERRRLLVALGELDDGEEGERLLALRGSDSRAGGINCKPDIYVYALLRAGAIASI